MLNCPMWLGEIGLLPGAFFGGGRVEVSLTVVSSIGVPPHDKTNKISVRPAKTQTSLGIRPV